MHSVCATYLDRWTITEMRSRLRLSHTEQGKGVLLAIQHEERWFPWSISRGLLMLSLQRKQRRCQILVRVFSRGKGMAYRHVKLVGGV